MLKSLLPKAVIALLLSTAAFAQVPVGAQLTDGAGHGVNGSFLRFELWNCGANFPVNTVNPLIIVQRRFDLKANSAGIVTGQVIPNDQIKCGGVVSTRWMVTPMKDATTPLTETQRFDILFANGAFNPATSQPDISVPPIPGFRLIYSNPSGNQSIVQPTGTSLAIVGALDLTQAIVTGITQGGGSSGLACNTGSTSGVVYWDAPSSSCKVDITFQTDGSGNVIGATLTLSGGLSAATVSTTGTGGVLDGQPQVAPSSITQGHYQVFENVNTGLLDCLKNPAGTLITCMPTSPVIASGTTALTTSSVSSGGCNVSTSTATGAIPVGGVGSPVGTRIVASPGVDPTGVTGYAPSSSGSLSVFAWTTANTVNFKVCNYSANPITPGALTMAWVVL